jgi:hypothetical protein
MTKRIVKKVDFSKEGSHICICGLPANGQEEVTILKSKETNLNKMSEEVKITTSMKNFLQTFFNMWDDEAATLAKILGYDVNEWCYDYIGGETEVEILKGAHEENQEVTVNKETYDNLKKAKQEFGKLYRQHEKETTMSDKKTSGDTNTDLQKSIDEAVKVALKKEKEKFEAELKKAKDEAAELKKAAEQKAKDEMTELCKGYSFVEDAEVLSEALFLCKSVKGFDVILDTLEKARTAIKASLETEIGTDEEVDLTESEELPENLTKTTEILKKRKENK